jgi:[acyl-carrier-protein] S-malonyltransferase
VFGILQDLLRITGHLLNHEAYLSSKRGVSMSKIAFVFPGQGSQYVGMGSDFIREFSVSSDVFLKADQALGFCISRLCFDGPEEELIKTENAQPAILTTSIAILKAVEQMGIKCDITAGLSLGEYTSLVYSGALSFEDAVRVVKNRGKYMQEAVPLGVGAMAAIVGLDIDRLTEILQSSKELGVVEIANYNSHEQIVISGEKNAIKDAAKKAKHAGATKAVVLPVSAPFHCSLLKPAQERLETDLNEIRFSDSQIPIVTNVFAKPSTEKEVLRSALVKQVSHSVLWKDSVETMLDLGVDTFVEIGPGDTLTKLVRKIAEHNEKEIRIFTISTVDQLKEFFEYSGS